MLSAHVSQQRLHQVRNIFTVIAQWQHVNVENIQPIVKIVTQLAARNGFFGHLVSGREYADVNCGFNLASEAAQLTIFQYSQQLGLGCDGHFPNLVKQQSSAFSQFEASGATFKSARKRALFVTENFAFD